ncbi:MAG: O-antigen ligase family protein [Patescibacteria group bacterium]
MGLLKSLFILIIFLFAFGEVIRIPFAGLSIKLIDVGIAALTVYWVLFGVINLKKIKIDKKRGIPMLIFFAAALLSLVLNARFLNINELFVSSLYLTRWVAYASIIFIIPMFDNSFKKIIIKLLIFIGIFIVVLGYIQYLFYPNLRNLYYLGWDEHLYRLFSTFLDPNFAGAFFVLYFLFVLNILIDSLKKQARFFSFSIGLILLFTLIAIFLTYSRSALLMLITGSFVFLFLNTKKTFAILIVVVFLSVTVLLPKAYKTEGTNFFRIASSQARLDSAKQAIEIFKEDPLFGVGFNAYRYAKDRHGFTFGDWEESHADAGTDNSFLFLLATVGITGFIAYLYMWFKILKINIRSKLLIVSVVAIFVDSLFVNSLFYSFLMFWIWILVGLYGE